MDFNLKDLDYKILPDDYSKHDLSFKVIVIGDSGVGKSCLTNKAIKNIFEENYSATVGFEFCTFNIKINNKIIKLQIWDTCGQELYRSLITNFYRNTSFAVIVYAINSENSFNDIDMWLKELRTNSNPDVKIILIGNKMDLEKERKISKEQGELYAKNNNLIKFYETSAKNGINVQSTFVEIAYILYKDYKQYMDDENSNGSAVIKGNIKKIDNRRRKKSSCCS